MAENDIVARGYINYAHFSALCRKESVKASAKYQKNSPYVLVSAGNSLSALVRIYAAWMAGYTPVLISPAATKDELRDYRMQLPRGTKVYSKMMMSRNEIAAVRAGSRMRTFEPEDEKEAVVIFTSGSTGRPKGIVHTFGSLRGAAGMQNKVTRADVRSEWLLSLPLYHIGGFMIFFRAMMSGSGIYIAEKSGAAYLRGLLMERKITHLSVVPAQCSELLQTPEVFSNVKCVLLGGGPVEKRMIIELRKRKIPTQIIYGSSETAAFCSAVKPEDVKNPKRLGTKPLKGVKFLAVDENRKPLPAGKEGRIVLSSPSLFKGYLKSEQECFFEIRKRRYYITSDMGFIDGEGFVHITRRADAIIITGGKKVSVSEVERALLEIDGVDETKVFGVKDDYWGERVYAAVGAADEGVTAEFISSELKMKLSSYKVPKKWLIVTALPRTALGKVDTAGLMRMME